MKRPVAKPTGVTGDTETIVRTPRAFAPDQVANLPEVVATFEEAEALPDVAPTAAPEPRSAASPSARSASSSPSPSVSPPTA